MHFVFIEEVPIEVGINQVQSNAKDFAVSNMGNVLIVQGAKDGERVCAYTLDGQLIGSSFSRNGSASLSLETVEPLLN